MKNKFVIIIILIVIHLLKKYKYQAIINNPLIPASIANILNNDDVLVNRIPDLSEMDDFDNLELNNEEDDLK